MKVYIVQQEWWEDGVGFSSLDCVFDEEQEAINYCDINKNRWCSYSYEEMEVE